MQMYDERECDTRAKDSQVTRGESVEYESVSKGDGSDMRRIRVHG
jgi:hypothetical protein